jgi:hypothetical protein
MLMAGHTTSLASCRPAWISWTTARKSGCPSGVHPANRQIRNSHFLNVIGRLKDDVTPQAAQTELSVFLENWGERAGTKGHVPTKQPARVEDHILELQPLREAIVADASRAIWVLQAAVGLVLLIGCANLANLAMARAESRRREFAVRTALGASGGRLLRQAITEGMLLSVGGGVLGLWLAHAGVPARVLAYPTSLPRASEVAFDFAVLLFALGVDRTALLFGLAPVGLRRAHDVVTVLKEAETLVPAAGPPPHPPCASGGRSRARDDDHHRRWFAARIGLTTSRASMPDSIDRAW